MEGLIGLWSIWKAIGMQKQPFGLGQPDRDPAKAPVDPRNVTPVTARSRKDWPKDCGRSQGDVFVMSSVSLRLLVWPGDPEPGRSALDEKQGTSTKPADRQRSSRRWAAPSITLPKGAGEFSRLASFEDLETELASD